MTRGRVYIVTRYHLADYEDRVASVGVGYDNVLSLPKLLHFICAKYIVQIRYLIRSNVALLVDVSGTHLWGGPDGIQSQ